MAYGRDGIGNEGGQTGGGHAGDGSDHELGAAAQANRSREGRVGQEIRDRAAAAERVELRAKEERAKRARAKEIEDISLFKEAQQRGVWGAALNHVKGLLPGVNVQARNYKNATIKGQPIDAPNVVDVSAARAVGDVMGLAFGVPGVGDVADAATKSIGFDTTVNDYTKGMSGPSSTPSKKGTPVGGDTTFASRVAAPTTSVAQAAPAPTGSYGTSPSGLLSKNVDLSASRIERLSPVDRFRSDYYNGYYGNRYG